MMQKWVIWRSESTCCECLRMWSVKTVLELSPGFISRLCTGPCVQVVGDVSGEVTGEGGVCRLQRTLSA